MREVAEKSAGMGARFGLALDRAISVFAPGYGLRRWGARQMLAARGGGYWGSGTRGRGTRDSWSPGGGSADEDILHDLPALRERSRDLNRNNGQAAGITGTMVDNVVGTGIRTQSRIRGKRVGISDERAAELCREAESVFEDWRDEADAGERLDFYGLQELAYRQFLENGESILVRRILGQTERRRLSARYVAASLLSACTVFVMVYGAAVVWAGRLDGFASAAIASATGWFTEMILRRARLFIQSRRLPGEPVSGDATFERKEREEDAQPGA